MPASPAQPPARLAGVAHGWEGHAWVALASHAAGLAPPPPLGPLRARLRGRMRARRLGPSLFIGLGGAGVVALQAATLDRALLPLAREVMAAWASAEAVPVGRDDVYLGHAGALLALAEVAPLPAGRAAVPARFIRRCHVRAVASLRHMLSAAASPTVGMAHGVAGMLLALEAGAARLGLPRPAALLARGLGYLVRHRLVAPGLGTVWTPRRTDPLDAVTGSWCHGVAGIALALHSAHRHSGVADYLALFTEVAPAVGVVPALGPTFCCGQAGAALVQLELARQTGDPRWRARAAAPPGPRRGAAWSRVAPDGFAQGRLGLAWARRVLAAPALARAAPMVPGLGGLVASS